MTRRTTRQTSSKPARATYTDEQRAEALALYREHGPTEASRRCGIPPRTITRWATKAGVATEVTAKTAAAWSRRRLAWRRGSRSWRVGC